VCGIAGSLGADRPDEERVRRTLARMRRRGPDHQASRRDTLGEHQLTLLHARLSIIDALPRSNQPFVSDGCALVFNGEIYNHEELRAQLVRAGHTFTTRSDTEVIVRAWREWGTACVDRFEGMWSLALHDEGQGTLWLSRDRFGEKPLFLLRHAGTLYFASQVSFLTALSGRTLTPNRTQLRRFLVHGYKSLFKQRDTWFDEVEELPAGTSVLLTGPDAVSPERYWQLEHRPQAMTLQDAQDRTRLALERAVELRLRADVPMTLCLSGGVDSNVIAGLAVHRFGQQLRTFSLLDDDPRYDESESIAAAVEALGCEHHEVRTTHDGFVEQLTRLVDYQQAPVTTITAVLQSRLLEAIAAGGYRATLLGTGADELFTGYYDHYGMWLAAMRDRPDFEALVDDWRAGYGSHVRNPLLQDPHAFAERPDQREHIYLGRDLFNGRLVEPLEEGFVEQPYGDELLRNRMLNELFHESVPVSLREADHHAMYYSVENRSPFLDRELAELLFTVPTEHLVHDGMAKWLLRAAGEGVVPDVVRLDRRKRGFNAPIDSLIDVDDPRTRELLLGPGPIWELVRRDAMESCLRADVRTNSESKFLFSLLSTRLFLERADDDGGS
jgi:asparagine synthase (glutamine-hydrolysing)